MATKSKTFTILAFFFTLLCLTLIIIGFATDRWVVSSLDSGFQNLGLWSVCLKQYEPPNWSVVSKRYDGCWWTLDKEMDDLRHFLFPYWFKATQGLVTFSLVLVLLALIVMIVNVINCFPYSIYKQKVKVGLSMTAAIMLLLTGLFLAIALMLFGIKVDNERTWLENPDNFYLSWSFGLVIGATFMAILGGMSQLLEFFRHKRNAGMGDAPRVFLTNQPPQQSNYSYSQRPPEKTNADFFAGQPEYARKYAEDSQSSINRAPEPVFKVSGSGELYINRLANRDGNRDYHDGRNNYSQHVNRDVNVPSYDKAPPYSNVPRYASERRPQQEERSESIDTQDNDNDPESDHTEDDYEASKKLNHPSLPEYVPKNQDKLKEIEKRKYESDDDKKKKKSTSKSKDEASKSRRNSSKKKKNYDSVDDRKKKSKKRYESSDDEHSRSKRRSKRSGSKQRNTSRSRSRDLAASYSDDSDTKSDRSRSRKRHKDDKPSSRKSSKKRTTSKERSLSKDKLSESDGRRRKDNRDSSDDGSRYNSRVQTKSKGVRDYITDTKPRTRDFSDSESVRSKQSRRTAKPTGYSSYYA